MKIATPSSITLIPVIATALALALGACANPPAATSSAPAAAPVAAAPAPVMSAPVVATPAPMIAAVPAPSKPAPAVVQISTTPAPVAVVAAGSVDFDKQIRPFLAEHCLRCHSGPRPSSGLNLANTSGLKIGVQDNLIYDVLLSKGSDHMPPRSQEPLTADEIAMIKQWLAEGGKYPANYLAGN